MRERRSLTPGKTLDLPDGFRIETAQDILIILEASMLEIIDCDIDAVIRGRALAYLAGAVLKAIEIANMEERLAAVEAELNLGRSA